MTNEGIKEFEEELIKIISSLDKIYRMVKVEDNDFYKSEMLILAREIYNRYNRIFDKIFYGMTKEEMNMCKELLDLLKTYYDQLHLILNLRSM